MKITSSIHFVVILTLGTWFSSNSGVIPRNKSNSMGFSWEFSVKCAEKIGIFIRDPSMELSEYKNIKYNIKLI